MVRFYNYPFVTICFSVYINVLSIQSIYPTFRHPIYKDTTRRRPKETELCTSTLCRIHPYSQKSSTTSAVGQKTCPTDEESGANAILFDESKFSLSTADD